MQKISLKLFLLLLVLFCFSFSAYSQESDQVLTSETETPMIAPILIQLHQISIQQAKKSSDPQTELEKEFTQIVNELEQTYLQREKALEAKYQAKLTEQEANSQKQVNEVEQKAQMELSAIQIKVDFLERQSKKDFWSDAGTFGSGFSLGVGVASVVGIIYFASLNSQ